MRKGGPDNKWNISPLQVNISGNNKTPEQRFSKRMQRRQEETEVLSGQIQTSSTEVIEVIMKIEVVPKKTCRRREDGDEGPGKKR